MSDRFPIVWRQVFELQAFGPLFTDLARIGANEILTDLQILLESNRLRMNNKIQLAGSVGKLTRGDIESCRADVLQEMLNLKAGLKNFSDPLSEYSRQEIELRCLAPELVDAFFNNFSHELDEIFEAKRLALHKDVDAEVTWTTDIEDSVRKISHNLLGWTATIADKMGSALSEESARELAKSGAEARAAQSKINKEALLIQIWNRHMADENEQINRLLARLFLEHDQAWKALLANAEVSNENDWQFGMISTGKVQPEGIESSATRVGQAGTAVTAAATVSLAMGWHTFSYAMLHVFPPAALLSIAATALIGIRQEKEYRQQVKDQFSRCLQLHRQTYIQVWFEGNEINGYLQEPLRTGMMQDSNRRVEVALLSWRRRLFGQLTPKIFESVIAASEQHLTYLDNLLDLLDEKLTETSREHPEYSFLRGKLGHRYPTLDAVSIDMLATGELLLMMHQEQPFPECSPVALPFVKVLERQLSESFKTQYSRCNWKGKKQGEFLLGAFIGFVEDGQIRDRWPANFIARLQEVNRVRRSIAHRTPVEFEKAARVRELVSGTPDLLGDIAKLI